MNIIHNKNMIIGVRQPWLQKNTIKNTIKNKPSFNYQNRDRDNYYGNNKQNINDVNQVQLFSKLKRNQIAKSVGIKQGKRYSISNRYKQNHDVYTHQQKLYPQSKNRQGLELTEHQIYQINKLKQEKANFIAKYYLYYGKSTQQIMRQHIMPSLNKQIERIITGQRQVQQYQDKRKQELQSIIQQINALRGQQFKNLQSTAEYHDSPPAHQHYQIHVKHPHTDKSIQRCETKINQLSTIKVLSSPEHLQQIEKDVSNFTETVKNNSQGQHSTKNNRLNTQNNQVKVLQFTLGNLNENQLVSETQYKMKQGNKIIGKNDDVVNEYDDESFGQNYKNSNVESPYKMGQSTHKRQENSKQKNNLLCFSRKKVPKGKSIKIKVMGHFDNDQGV